MRIEFVDLEDCPAATGTVVVVDVCRAFTTAACALDCGAERILLAGTPSAALELRDRHPGALVMGEVEGLPVPGFDFWNSPGQVSQANLAGRTVVQRTSSGTQGIVRAGNAESLLAASFVVAGATARAIRQRPPHRVTFVITGGSKADQRHGAEDRACAEYITALLRGEQPDPGRFLGWMGDLFAAHAIDELPEPLRTQMYADLAYCRAVDRFSFAMPVEKAGELLIMKKMDPLSGKL